MNATAALYAAAVEKYSDCGYEDFEQAAMAVTRDTDTVATLVQMFLEENRRRTAAAMASKEAEVAKQAAAAAAATAEREAAAKAAEAVLQAAVSAAWAAVEAVARQADDLPIDRSAIYGRTSRHECGDKPARWVATSSPSDDGTLSDGDGGRFFVGAPTAYNVESSVLELRADWLARWNAARADGEAALAAFIEAFRAAVGVATADLAAEAESKRVTTDAELQKAERRAFLAIQAIQVPDMSGWSPVMRRSSEGRLELVRRAGAELAECQAIKCPTAMSAERKAEKVSKLNECIARNRLMAEKATAMEAIEAKGDEATVAEIEALLNAGWLFARETRRWSDRLEELKERSEGRPAQPGFNAGAWSNLDGLK